MEKENNRKPRNAYFDAAGIAGNYVTARTSRFLDFCGTLFLTFYRSSPQSLFRMSPERIVNYNKRLYGPGPVARLPASGIRGYYARMPPLQGFCMAATHGVILGLGVGLYYKFFMADPDTKKIEQYYRENPPR